MNEYERDDRFVVDDLAKAEWCMKKIASLQKDINEKEEQAKRMKEEYSATVDAWLATECESANGDIAFFRSILEPFIKAEIEKSNGKKKSIKLPSGSCGYRKQGAVFRLDGKVLDAKSDALVEWLRQHDRRYIRQTESVDWKEFKQTLVATEDGRVMIEGEILEGFTAEVPEATFYTKGRE